MLYVSKLQKGKKEKNTAERVLMGEGVTAKIISFSLQTAAINLSIFFPFF